MKKFLLSSIVLFICSIALQSFGQYSKQQATNLVLNQILSGELNNIDVYVFDDTLAVEVPIVLAYGDSISIPYPSAWVYFVDDGPFMNWLHPCRFIIVCDSTGNYTVTEEEEYPINWASDYSSISLRQRPTPVSLQTDTNIRIEEVDPDPNKYAVLICHLDNKRFWNNASAIYCTLIDAYGYEKENIFVHYAHGYSTQYYEDDLDGPDANSDDIDYCAYKETLHHTFNELAGLTNDSSEIPALEQDDQLFICFFGHGGMTQNDEHSFIGLPSSNGTHVRLIDTTFAHYLENISCSQMIIFMNNCRSGKFIDEFMDNTNYDVQCKNRSVHTASYDETAHPEIWITNFGFDEMAYYWTAAARGYYPLVNQPWIETDTTGFFPFNLIPFDSIHPADYNPDVNNDGFVQMAEAFDYANNWNTWSESGFYCPLVDSVIPDQNGWDDPQDSVNISFSDTLLSLAGISGIVKESKTIENRSYTLCGPLTIDSNTTITLEGGTSIYMINDTANIIVEEGASLVCQNGYTYITGLTEDNEITINGSFTPGDNNTFDHVPEIILNNANAQTNFNNVTFNDTTILKNYGDSLSIDSSLVENCLGVYSFASDVYISNTRFVNSSVVVSNSGETTSHSITVEDCDFDYLSSNAMAAIKLMCCDEFFIEDNEISNYDKGIEAWYSGEGTSGNQIISGNEIDETDNGILLYNTIATVAGNNIYDNEYGVRFLSRSNVEFKGDSLGIIQYISDNDSYEVYCSEQSFPWYFRFNEVKDADNSGNPTDALVYHNSPEDSVHDVRFNCWDSSFTARDDLYPEAAYTTLPYYCTSKKSSAIHTPDEELYKQALAYFETGNYDSAHIFYDSLVIHYNHSSFSKAALKDMFALEQFTGNQYGNLKTWYKTNDSILADTSLNRLAGYLANKCDIELGNYQTAFNWFDSVIANPYSFEDSIFAVIDRDFLSLQTGSNALKEISFNLKGSPSSYHEFKIKSDYLISLLPGELELEQDIENNHQTSKHAQIINIAPNPFHGFTHMQFEVLTEGNIAFEVCDISGRRLKTISNGYLEAGVYKQELNLTSIENGVYLISILYNSKASDTYKISVFW